MQLVFQTPCSPGDSGFGRCFIAGHATYCARLVDELAGSRSVFIDFVPNLKFARRPKSILLFLVHTYDFYNSSNGSLSLVDIFTNLFRLCIFRYCTGNGIFSGCGRRKFEHVACLFFHDLTVHAPFKTGMVKIFQQGTQKNGTADKSVLVRGCLSVRRGWEFDDIGHRFHNLHIYFPRCRSVHIGSIDCHRIGTGGFFVESISLFRGNDLTFSNPFNFEAFHIRRLDIGSKCVIGIPDNFQPL